MMVAGIALALVITVGVTVLVTKEEERLQPSGTTLGLSSEQDIQATQKQQEELVMQPDINSEEFVVTASNVNCSTTEINGQVSKSCSGNIRVVPKENKGLSPGLYKINEQTRLLHGGVEEDINNLQQLAQSNTVVTLALTDGSGEMLKEIRY